MSKIINISVHSLIDFFLRSGHIDNRIFNNQTMKEGTKIHSLYQSKQPHNYYSEYPLRRTFEYKNYVFNIDGIADGLTIDKEITITEIKSTVGNLVEFHIQNELWHLSQAKIYALIYALNHKLANIRIKLVYISQISNETKEYDYCLDITTLQADVEQVFESYIQFDKLVSKRIKTRNKTIDALKFPHGTYREGQYDLAKYVYSTCKEGGTLFVEAPTGIGKTISTLFPSIKYLKTTNSSAKIFYLTAKNSGQESAINSINIMHNNGLKNIAITIKAKDKMCLNGKKLCNPDDCPYAKDYYTKLNDVIKNVVKRNEPIGHNELISLAQENMMCPFELSLDISSVADVVICDYNYFFCPFARFQRHFTGSVSKNHIVLVDEAHNLIDRSRSNYSEKLIFSNFLVVFNIVKSIDDKKIHTPFNSLKKYFTELKNTLNDGDYVLDILDEKLMKALVKIQDIFKKIKSNYSSFMNSSMDDFSMSIYKFLTLHEELNNNSILHLKKSNDDIKISIVNLDPSEQISYATSLVNSICFFSATLSPIDYYISSMCNKPSQAPYLLLNSPFSADQLKLMIAPNVSIKYKNRNASYEKVSDMVESFISEKIGNYFVYVPSFEYLDALRSYFDGEKNYSVFIQSKDMTDIDKQIILASFEYNPKKTTICIAVMGGSFSEGIDLVEDRLIGVVIVGVGLPSLSFENELIKTYYDEKIEPRVGYEYAYTNPGLNKIMQSVGRLIRTENDRGAALLIDDRYLSSAYTSLFKHEWRHYDVVLSPEEIKDNLKSFWKT